jgi:signal transduction histidine kinase
MLAAIANNLGQARRLAERISGAALDDVLDECAELLHQVTSEIRTVSYLLHPPLLDELGLEYVVPWYVEGFSRRSGIVIDIDVPSGFGRLASDIELTLFRITQEALSNVHRHSGSGTARVRLWRTADHVELSVEDDGRGLARTLPETTEAFAALGIGIAGMRERARQLGGYLEITGSERGTIVRAVLSARAAEESAA